MKLEIEISEGDDLTWLELWRDHSAIVRDHAREAATRAMADKVFLALENVLRKRINPSKGD
jgi:hypothetical protein